MCTVRRLLPASVLLLALALGGCGHYRYGGSGDYSHSPYNGGYHQGQRRSPGRSTSYPQGYGQ